MNTQTKITWFAFMIALFWISYWLVCNSNAKAMEEYMNLAQEKTLLEQQKQEESEWWWIDEEAKNECIQSWTDHQNQRKKKKKKRTQRIAEIEEQMGLIESSQAQKKINMNESKSSMNDTQAETQDNWWFKRLLRWVESLWSN